MQVWGGDVQALTERKYFIIEEEVLTEMCISFHAAFFGNVDRFGKTVRG
jgi:hypothetical protein